MRDRLDLLLDAGSFVEDGLLANAAPATCPADGVVTGMGTIDGRPVCVMANDPTVKAGSWGARTVEKIVRLTELALRDELPVFWLVDSAGARITDQVQLFPGRRGAGRIFYNQVRLSGKVPQICCLFGPSAAGGAYIPSFCDIVIMVEGNASMYLGSPRMAEMVIGEITTLEEMGGARMHATRVGLRRQPGRRRRRTPSTRPGPTSPTSPLVLATDPPEYVPAPPGPGVDRRPRARPRSAGPTTCTRSSTAWSTPRRFFEVKPLFAPELIVGFGRLDGRAGGHRGQQPGGTRAACCSSTRPTRRARFIWCCDAFNIPLVFLADVPGLHGGHRGRARRASSATGPR